MLHYYRKFRKAPSSWGGRAYNGEAFVSGRKKLWCHKNLKKIINQGTSVQANVYNNLCARLSQSFNSETQLLNLLNG